MTTWFTSDLHIGHKNIIKYCSRPFADVAAMNEALIANWNAVVAPDDTVYDLGDFAFCTSSGYALEVLRQLNGQHHLVRGNHEEAALASGYVFASRTDGIAEIEIEGQAIVLCHYALREWHHALRGVWHLFGHTHANLGPFGKSVDVGVDNAKNVVPGGAAYRPVSFAEVKAFMDARPVGPHPAIENFEVRR